MSQENSQKKSLSKRTFDAFWWQFSSVAGRVILQFPVLIVLSRLLPPKDFGLIGITMIFVTFASIISDVGVSGAIVQRRNLDENHIRVAFTISSVFGLLTTIILFSLSPFISMIFGNPDVEVVTRVISISVIISSLGVVSYSLLQREMQFKYILVAELVSYILGYALIGITLALFDLGVWALIWALLAQAGLRTIILFIFFPHSVLPRFSGREAKELLSFGSGFTLARIFNFGANQGDYFVVGKWLGSDMLGLYTRAYQLMMLPTTYFSTVLDKVIFPAISEIQNEMDRLRQVYLSGVAVISIVSIPFAVCTFIIAPQFISVLFGEQWIGAILPLQIMCIGMLFRASYKISESFAKAKGAVYRTAICQFAYAVFVISGAFIGRKWGIKGVSVGVIFAIFLQYVLTAQLCLIILELKWIDFIKSQLPGIYFGLVIACVMIPSHYFISKYISNEIIQLFLLFLLSCIFIVLMLLLLPKEFFGTNFGWILRLSVRNIPFKNKLLNHLLIKFDGI